MYLQFLTILSSLWLGVAFVPHTKHPCSFSLSRTTHWLDSNESLQMAATAREAINWIKAEQLESILPKQDALNILDELLSDEELINDSESVVMKNLDKLEKKLLGETRSVAEFLGKETTDSILKTVENVDGYDPDAVRAFLGSEAVNKLLAQVLYDGIYNFFQTIDVFGNIIGKHITLQSFFLSISYTILTNALQEIYRLLDPLEIKSVMKRSVVLIEQ